MAVVFSSKCRNCSYQTTIRAGRGRDQTSLKQIFPIYCDQCQDITSADYGAEHARCLQCRSNNFRHIDDQSVYAGDGEFAHYTWFGKTIPGTRKITMTRPPDADQKLSLRQKFSLRFMGYYITMEPNRAIHTITDGHYLCPGCLTHNLKLVDSIIAHMD